MKCVFIVYFRTRLLHLLRKSPRQTLLVQSPQDIHALSSAMNVANMDTCALTALKGANLTSVQGKNLNYLVFY